MLALQHVMLQVAGAQRKGGPVMRTSSIQILNLAIVHSSPCVRIKACAAMVGTRAQKKAAVAHNYIL
jgi:hypothetical protein